MRPSFVRTSLAVAVAAAALAAPAAAQLRVPPVQLIVGMGPLEANTLGFIGERGRETVSARHLNANALMLGVQARTPLRGVDLRLSVQHATPMLVLGDQLTTPTSLTTVALDAVVNLPRLGGVHPYVLAGGGFKRYGFDQERFRLSGAEVVPHDETDAMAHAGIGAFYDVGRVDLFVEASASSNRFENNPTQGFSRNAQNYAFSFGVRIPLHR
jgi:hypothetical protein